MLGTESVPSMASMLDRDTVDLLAAELGVQLDVKTSEDLEKDLLAGFDAERFTVAHLMGAEVVPAIGQQGEALGLGTPLDGQHGLLSLQAVSVDLIPHLAAPLHSAIGKALHLQLAIEAVRLGPVGTDALCLATPAADQMVELQRRPLRFIVARSPFPNQHQLVKGTIAVMQLHQPVASIAVDEAELAAKHRAGCDLEAALAETAVGKKHFKLV
jgi:hypothetical protein